MQCNTMLKFVAVACFIMTMFNIFDNYFYFLMDDEERQIAYAQVTTQIEWSLLNADLNGNGASWKPNWDLELNNAKATLDTSPYGCLEVSGVEDAVKFDTNNAELRAAGGQAPLRAVRARGRASNVMRVLQEKGVLANRIREGAMVTEARKGARGVIVRLIEDCLPKPPVNCWDRDGDYQNDLEEDVAGSDDGGADGAWDAKDCIGADGADGDVDIDYDLMGQFMLSMDRPEFYGLLLRANFPISESWSLGVGVENGTSESVVAAGFELSAEYDSLRWFKPRFVLVGRAFDIDSHLYFGRGEIGGGVGLVGEFAEFDYFSLIYEIRGEWKGDVESRRGWRDVKSGVAQMGVRF